MRSHTLFTSAALMASAASAFPHNHASFSHPHGVSKRADPSGQTVVYWGQNGGGTIENNDLSTYCTSASGINVIVLAFLYEFGNGQEIPVGTIGQSCYISTSGQGQNCDNVASSIPICQAAGIKIIISLGGASGSYSLTSQAEAETIGQYLWESYGNSGNTTVQRPFGNAFVNGFDFDIEVNSSGNQYYQYMISTLRSNFASDPSNTYYITGAPQCPIPEPNMGGIITSSAFDYLWVQWYNNNEYAPDPCSLGFNGGAPFNYEAWESYIAGTPSANAKIFIGAPASPLAANGSPSGEVYYITPDQLATLVGQTEGNSSFGGVMMWSAGFSDSNVNDGCTYAQESHEILLTGSPCAGSGSSGSSTTTASSSTHTTTTSTTTTSTTTTSAPTSTATGVVQQWGQCGGEGYTGPTQCASPYSCVSTSVWWAQCE